MNLSSIKLSKDAITWLKEVWDHTRTTGRPPSYQTIRVRTKDIISTSFRPLDLPKELVDNNATEITLVGVLCCDPNTNILDIADRIFDYIKTKINSSPDQTEFESRLIASDLELSTIEIELTLNLISKYGSFWGSASKPADSAGYTNFKIDNPHVFETYSSYDSARSVIEENIQRYQVVDSVNKRLNDGRQRQIENTLLYALSIEEKDPRLISMGLTNRGPVGFILANYVDDSLPLTAIKLQFRSDDFLYTTKVANEKLEKRNPHTLGVVGYVFTQQRPNTIQLHRYFDKVNLVHLFTTKPKNIPKTFRDESSDNPIFIYESPVEGTIPLYSYSNQATSFSESITASFQDNVSITDELVIEITKRIHNRTDIKIVESNEMAPALGVEQLASEVAAVISHLKVEPGNMTGIFGPWGRGKSYLMNFIWKSLQAQTTNIQYLKVNYQAWRYQDTPAAWAYLYETFSRCYLGDPKAGLADFLKYNWRLWKLNIHREGYLTLITILFFLLAGSVTYTIATFNWDQLGLQLLKLLGIPTAGFIIYFITTNLNLSYFSKAFNIIKKYGVRATFKDNLGIQAEIQKELVHLISVWTASNANSKVVLFVDDLDRCREEKTIEIIDSLRIILDDEKVKDKLIVVCAIDDRILKRAILKKYQGVENENANLLVREYIDKLFIFTLKLAPLNNSETREFFQKLTTDAKEDKKLEQGNLPDQSERSIVAPAVNEPQPANTVSLPTPENVNSNNEGPSPRIRIEKLNKISKQEIMALMDAFELMQNPTPRRIKIVYYRYLLAKNILISKHPGANNDNSFWLREVNQKVLMTLLILLSDKESKDITSLRRTALAESTEEIKLEVLNNLTVNRVEVIRLMDVLETVVAY